MWAEEHLSIKLHFTFLSAELEWCHETAGWGIDCARSLLQLPTLTLDCTHMRVYRLFCWLIWIMPSIILLLSPMPSEHPDYFVLSLYQGYHFDFVVWIKFWQTYRNHIYGRPVHMVCLCISNLPWTVLEGRSVRSRLVPPAYTAPAAIHIVRVAPLCNQSSREDSDLLPVRIFYSPRIILDKWSHLSSQCAMMYGVLSTECKVDWAF